MFKTTYNFNYKNVTSEINQLKFIRNENLFRKASNVSLSNIDYRNSYIYKNLYSNKRFIRFLERKLKCPLQCLNPDLDSQAVMIYKYHELGDNHNSYHFDMNNYHAEKATILLCIENDTDCKLQGYFLNDLQQNTFAMQLINNLTMQNLPKSKYFEFCLQQTEIIGFTPFLIKNAHFINYHLI